MKNGLGKEAYCKYCFACEKGIKCIASKDERREMQLCGKAKARMQEEDEKGGLNKYEALKKYLGYIPRRIAYLKMAKREIPSNEYKYYLALHEVIKQWGKSHVICYGCLCGKIKVESARAFIGVSESTFHRIMSRQKKDLILFIEKQEKILSEKYPHIPVSDICMEERK